MLIPFTQYLLPDGETRPMTIELDGDAANKAEEILDSGKYRFEIEMLRTSQISITCFDTNKEEDVSIEVCANGPPVVDATVRMIETAHKIIFK